jgi:hypothetical protein
MADTVIQHYETVRYNNFPLGAEYYRLFGTTPSYIDFESVDITTEELKKFLTENNLELYWRGTDFYRGGVDITSQYFLNKDKRCILYIAPLTDEVYKLNHTKFEYIVKDDVKQCKRHYIRIHYKAFEADLIKDIADTLKSKISPKEKGNGRISLVSRDSSGGLTTMEFKLPVKDLDIPLHYGEEFVSVYETIFKRLNTDYDKGIALFHGKPGCGKTSLIRYLVSQIKNKEVIFIPPYLVEQIASPEFLPFITEHPNSIFIVEDGERVLASRDSGEGSSQGVSSLLNMGDGLLSDCLNVQFVCTFNTSIKNIDSALLRKGRLIAEYEFKPLSVENSNKLLKHLGKEEVTKVPMTLADIYGADEVQIKSEDKRAASIGFSNRNY